MNYPFYYQQPQMNQPQMNQQPQIQPISGPTDDRIWVQSDVAAEAYMVAPNATVHLWDSSKPYIYIRKTDAAGRPMPLEVLEYKKREEIAQASQFESALDELRARIEALEQKGIKNAKTKSNADDALCKRSLQSFKLWKRNGGRSY